jgi:hypothetical protein
MLKEAVHIVTAVCATVVQLQAMKSTAAPESKWF